MPKITVGYTIFNKAHLLPEIVDGIKRGFHKNDEIIFYYDNCTDGSFKLGRELMPNARHFFSVTDQFEVKANNEILRRANNEVIVLFQDDIICKDFQIKDKIEMFLQVLGDEAGVLGGRDGFELNSLDFPERPVGKASSWVHKKHDTHMLMEGDFMEKTFVNRGPLVFTKKLLETVGYLNEDYYPQYCDDMEYCARAKFIYGKKNVVFQCRVESKLEWGATRQKNTPLYQLTKGKHYKKNWNLFISTFGGHILK